MSGRVEATDLKDYQSCWAIGPTKAWYDYSRYLPLENVETDGTLKNTTISSKNKIIEITSSNYGFGKGMSWGKYVF